MYKITVNLSQKIIIKMNSIMTRHCKIESSSIPENLYFTSRYILD